MWKSVSTFAISLPLHYFPLSKLMHLEGNKRRKKLTLSTTRTVTSRMLEMCTTAEAGVWKARHRSWTITFTVPGWTVETWNTHRFQISGLEWGGQIYVAAVEQNPKCWVARVYHAVHEPRRRHVLPGRFSWLPGILHLLLLSHWCWQRNNLSLRAGPSLPVRQNASECVLTVTVIIAYLTGRHISNKIIFFWKAITKFSWENPLNAGQ